MIATLILCGIVFGHWWRVTLVVSAVGWPLLLVADGVAPAGPGLVGAAALAVANAGAGVLVHHGVRRAARLLRRNTTPRPGG